MLVAVAFLPALAFSQPRVQASFVGTILADTIGAARLSHPMGLAIDPAGNLYVADTGNHRLLECTPAGRLLREVGGFGFDREQFDQPVDIWAGNGLDVFVADYNNQRLERYDKDLNYISSYYPNEALAEELQFGYPAAIALSSQGELFVAEHEFNRVLRFDAFGKPQSSFGDFNWGEGGLDRPAKIFISSRGELFVSDSTRGAITLYDIFGNFIARIGEGLLGNPAGMAEWRDIILVADRGRHRIVCLTRAGEACGEFGAPGSGPGSLSSPATLAILPSSRISEPGSGKLLAQAFVLDTGNNRVQIFELK